MQFGLWARSGSRNHEIDGVPIPHEMGGQFLGKGSPTEKYRDFLPWAVRKRLNRSICRSGCGLGCAEGSTNSIVFARWRQYALHCSPMWAHWRHLANTIEPSVCGGDAVLCQITLTTCYCHYLHYRHRRHCQDHLCLNVVHYLVGRGYD